MNEPAFIAIHRRPERAHRGAGGALHLRRAVDPATARPAVASTLVEISDTGEPIGLCGLLKRESLPDPDIGFAFLRAYWSRGYAFEAAAAVRDYARDVLRLPRLLAITNPGNTVVAAAARTAGTRLRQGHDGR